VTEKSKEATLINNDGTWETLEVESFAKDIHAYRNRSYGLFAHAEGVGFYIEIPKDDEERPMKVQLIIENLQNDKIRLEKEKTTLIQQTRDIISIHSLEMRELKDVIIHQARVLAGGSSGDPQLHTDDS